MRPLSSFTWNEIVFRSFQAGFLKQLDLDFYRRLKLAAAKRMYRFLGQAVPFLEARCASILRVFACEHVGLSRRYDAAQLKRRLNPAIAELEQAGFLAADAGERAVQPAAARGVGSRLRACSEHTKTGDAQRPLSDLEKPAGRTRRDGVAAVAARPRVSGELIEGKIAVFDALRQTDDRRISRNPAGFLVQSIRDDYVPPAGLGRNGVRQRCRSVAGRNDRESAVAARQRLASESTMYHVETSPVAEYLSRLVAAEREELEAKAMLAGPRHAGGRIPAGNGGRQ